MNHDQVIQKIEGLEGQLSQTILLKARFERQPLRALWFYAIVFLNRYTFLKLPLYTKTIWGDAMGAYESSAIGSVFFLGVYDIDMTLFLLKYRHADGDFLDIGSNIGYYALLGNQVIGEGGRVVAIEPTPSTYKTLKANVQQHERILPLELAVSDTEGTTTFIDYGYQHAVFNSTKSHDLSFLRGRGKEFQVPATTLDALCEKYGLRPSILKLDTEGTEAKILKHASKTIATYAPVVLLEVGGGEEWKDNNNDSLDLLASSGYAFFEVAQDGTLLPHERQESYIYKNLVCIPQSKVSAYA